STSCVNASLFIVRSSLRAPKAVFYSNSDQRLKAFPENTLAPIRLHLPPNLPAAAARNAIVLRVEAGPGEPGAEELQVLALLQAWCGTPRPPAFIQVTRAQLR